MSSFTDLFWTSYLHCAVLAGNSSSFLNLLGLQEQNKGILESAWKYNVFSSFSHILNDLGKKVRVLLLYR